MRVRHPWKPSPEYLINAVYDPDAEVCDLFGCFKDFFFEPEPRRMDQDKHRRFRALVRVAEALATSHEAEVAWPEINFASLEYKSNLTLRHQVVLVGSPGECHRVPRIRRDLDHRQRRAEIPRRGVVKDTQSVKIERLQRRACDDHDSSLGHNLAPSMTSGTSDPRNTT